jgi:hypothetical protein
MGAYINQKNIALGPRHERPGLAASELDFIPIGLSLPEDTYFTMRAAASRYSCGIGVSSAYYVDCWSVVAGFAIKSLDPTYQGRRLIVAILVQIRRIESPTLLSIQIPGNDIVEEGLLASLLMSPDCRQALEYTQIS